MVSNVINSIQVWSNNLPTISWHSIETETGNDTHGSDSKAAMQSLKVGPTGMIGADEFHCSESQNTWHFNSDGVIKGILLKLH